MRFLVTTVVVVAALIGPCVAYAQDDDGWGEIVGLMNGLGSANQQLLNQGILNAPAGAGGGLTPGFAEGLAEWAQTYARVLQSVDGAFDVDGAANGQRGFYDPFAPDAPNPLWEQLNRWQNATAKQRPAGYQSLQNYPVNPSYRSYRRDR